MVRCIAKPGRLLVATLVLTATANLFVPTPARAADPVEKLQEFPLDQVQITDEYQKGLFAKEMTYLLTTIDADKLLIGFKAMASGSNPTNLYGGWESRLIRGHTMGHWLSAVAHAYQQTKGNDDTLNAQIKTKIDHVMSMLKTYQQPNGFLFATPVDQFSVPEGKSGDSWVPWYTMHKILAGLVDVAKFTDNTDVLDVASKLGDWIYTRASGWDASTRSSVLRMEYGGMNDALYELYKLTNKANHLTAAHIFDETDLFTTTAAGTDTLNGRHANTTIPKFIGALNRYRTLGTDEKPYFSAADQFLSIVLKSHTYITGGNSEAEFFHEPGKLDAHRDAVNNETCNVYNMSKLGRDLFKVTGDVKYVDYYERVHINEILSSINPESAMTTYFKAMGTGYFKVFSSPTDHFWCCTGTGMENFTKLNDSVYFHDAKDLWLTYYVTSNLNWKDRGLSLTQTTDLPASNKVTVTITAAPTDAVNLNFRKPYWALDCQMGVAVNGQSVTATESNGFLSVSRVWKANDKVELTFPLLVQVSQLPDNPNAVAFTYGPNVLSAGLGIDTMNTAPQGIEVLQATKPDGLQDTITINSGTTISAWLSNLQSNLVQTPGKLEFNLKGTDSDGKLVFTPHYARYKDRYGIYFKLAGTAGGTVSAPVCPTIVSPTGGASGSGGASAVGGSSGAGGAAVAGAGGASSPGAGGSAGKTGTSGGSGGVSSSGGAVTASGGSASGGTVSGNGGSGGGGGKGGSGSGGASPGTNPKSSGACSIGGRTSSASSMLGLVLALGIVLRRQRRQFQKR